MQGRRNPFVAHEGVPWLLITLIVAGAAWKFLGLSYATLPALLSVLAYLLFRDPHRSVPAAPLGIVSPVDGKVLEAELIQRGILGEEVHRVLIQVRSSGTYTARCPVEGKIMDAHGDVRIDPAKKLFHGLWVQTDEHHDVLLALRGYRFGLGPKAFMRYGERVGQGQRCAYLRLTKFAEIQFPVNGRLLVKPGQRVTAGSDLLGYLPPH